MAERLKQIVPDRWTSVRKRSSTKCFCVYTRGDKGSGVECGSLLSCWSVRLNETGQILKGCSRDGVEETVEAGIEGCSGDGTEADLYLQQILRGCSRDGTQEIVAAGIEGCSREGRRADS